MVYFSSEININRPATEKQIIAVKKAGGEVWSGMTHQDVSEQFEKISNEMSGPDLDELQ